MLWSQAGIYTWLLAVTRRPVAAIAAYDAEAALKLVLTFGRHGVASSHLRTLASPKRVSSWLLSAGRFITASLSFQQAVYWLCFTRHSSHQPGSPPESSGFQLSYSTLLITATD